MTPHDRTAPTSGGGPSHRPPPDKTSEPKPRPGRDAEGRFVQGNPGGPGNPFARKTAALRKALLERVTEEDIQEIVIVLLLKAKQGDAAAARLLLSYVVGKPQPAVDPDTLDQHEWQTWLTRLLPIGELGALLGKWPTETLCGLLPALMLARDQDCRANFRAGIAAMEEAVAGEAETPSKERAPAADEGAGEPSPNGANGATAPSTNRENGDEDEEWIPSTTAARHRLIARLLGLPVDESEPHAADRKATEGGHPGDRDDDGWTRVPPRRRPRGDGPAGGTDS
jgi:hypothetical protein